MPLKRSQVKKYKIQIHSQNYVHESVAALFPAHPVERGVCGWLAVAGTCRSRRAATADINDSSK